MVKKEFVMLGRGDAGCYATCEPQKWGNSTSRASVSSMYAPIEDYFCRLVEGGIVVDKKHLFKDDYITCFRLVVGGPIPNELLAPSTLDCFGEVREWTDEDNATLAAILRGEKVEKGLSMTYVAMDVYVNNWRKLGARVGKRVGDEIVFDDGTRETIIEKDA